MSETQDDYLLYIITHYRQLRWQRFKTLFGELYRPRAQTGEESPADQAGPSLQHIRWTTVRALEWLRFCQLDFTKGEGVVTAYKACLARLPILGLPCAILCGARGPDTVAQLILTAREARAKIMVCRQPTEIPYVPQRVLVQAGSTAQLAEIAQTVGVQFLATPLAHRVMDRSGDLDAILANIAWEDAGPLNWKRQIFNSHTLRFSPGSVRQNNLELHKYEDPIRKVAKYYLIDKGHDSQKPGAQTRRGLVDLDWGRYAILRATNPHVLFFDPQNLMLAVPVGAPLPMRIAQSLALCSGFLPAIQSLTDAGVSPEQQYHVFPWIPASLAREIAAKTHQQLAELHMPLTSPTLKRLAAQAFTPSQLE